MILQITISIIDCIQSTVNNIVSLKSNFNYFLKLSLYLIYSMVKCLKNYSTSLNQQKVKKTVKRQIKNKTLKRNIAPSFPCRTRTGMSLAVSTAWHKRGFDSLTCNYFIILKIWKFYCQFLSFFTLFSWANLVTEKR